MLTNYMANAALYLTELVQESANAQQYDILLTKILGYSPFFATILSLADTMPVVGMHHYLAHYSLA